MSHSYQPDPVWRKASRSLNQGECVEIAAIANTIGIRDSKNTQSPVLTFTRREWRSFVQTARGTSQAK